MTREESEEPKATTDPPGPTDDGADTADAREIDAREADDIPLNIVDHEERTPPGQEDSAFEFLDETDSPDEGPVDRDATEADEVDAGDADEGAVGDDADGAAAGVDVGDAVGGKAADSDDDEEVQPIELLVQLAKNGEIDPWDIDIVRVTDKFLEALDEADLRTSGRALFYASVLLRMKSDELFATTAESEPEIPPWEAPFADEGEMDEAGPAFDPVESLEAEMERRLERKHARGKPETLDELVRDLREAERGSWWKKSRTYDTSNSPRGFNRGVQELSYHSGDDFRVDDEPTANDVTHTAHEEDIESVIEDVEAALAVHYEKGREEVLYAEIEEAGGTRMMTYLALLFLAHRGEVRLEQDELFGDLWIQQVTVEVEASEAVAD